MLKNAFPLERLVAALCLVAACLVTSTYAQPSQLEYLDRGLVAIKASENQIYVGWRLLVNDADNVAFNLYRSSNDGPALKLNATPIVGSTNYIDSSADVSSANEYTVRPVVDGVELAPSQGFTVEADAAAQQYLDLPLQIPPGGTTVSGDSYTYTANDISVGDLDGDGAYEFVVKWYPTNAQDNANSGVTGNTILDAYELDGTRLWRIDLGINIRSGAHYTQFIVYDLDGDGKAELACRTAEGSMDASGSFVANPAKFAGEMPPIDHAADRRNSGGYILQGPEFLTIYSGETGEELVSTLYDPQRVPGTYFPTTSQINTIWGDSYGNRIDRFLATVAYLDGERPSLVMCRGYYTRAVLAAYDFRDGALTKRWTFDTLNHPENDAYRGQGAHSLTVGDVDGDGKDEIVYGAASIDDDGTGLFSTGIGHGDALHLSDMDPDRPGLEVWMPHESPSSYGPYGSELHKAENGEVIFGVDGQGADVGRGAAADIDPRFRGFETWASRGGLHTVKGEPVATNGLPAMNFLVWWDADPLRELLDGVTISKWNWEQTRAEPIFSPEGVVSNNSTKATPCLSADLFGDWREEVVWRAADNSALRIYTTVIPATNRLVTLMHDRQYREAIAWQNVGYNQPPHTGYYIGDGMATPPKPEYFLANGNAAPAVSMLQPTDGAIIADAEAIALAADASDSDGSVEVVSFYSNESFLGSDLTEPYTALWDAAGGSYLLRAVATDDQGAQGISLPITVTIGHVENYDEATAIRGWTQLKTDYEGYHGSGYLVFSRPWDFMEFRNLDGGLIDGEKKLRIRYSHGAPGVKVCFLFVNGVRQTIQLPSTGTWTNWQVFEVSVPLQAGPTNVVKLQSGGGQALIDEIWVAGVIRNQAPDATLALPVDGASFPENAEITIKVDARDIGGSLDKVELFANGTVIATLTSEPFEYTWANAGEGYHTLRAIATDDMGSATESNEAQILVNDPPSIALASPLDGAYVPAGEVIAVAADADDGVGTVERVDFFQGDILLGSVEAAPFALDWSSDVQGPYTFTAVATDNRGAQTTSEPVSITVNPAGYSVTYQAEDAQLSGEAISESANSGYNGDGYVNFPTDGGLLEFVGVDGGSGSMAILRIRYALGAAAARSGIMTVNGLSQEIAFEPTGAWTNFVTRDFAFPFDAGESNSVSFASNGFDLANIDEISALGLQSEEARTYHAENATQENVIFETTNGGFNGTGYINFPGTGGGLEFDSLDGGIGGTVTMRVRYALGAAGVRTGNLIVNGETQPIDFASTGGWTNYVFMDRSIELRAGRENTIRFESIGGDLGNVDEIQLVGITPNEIPQVTLLTPTDEASNARSIFVIGDSTVANYGSSAYPQRGWGQELQSFIHDGKFVVQNRAIGGRSSRSFYEEGRWDSVKAELTEGDFLLVQFGHNDRDWTKAERYTPPEDYKTYLSIYVNEARELGVTPILVTPMVMNAWRDGAMRNVFTESGNDYAGAMKQVAAELSVPLVDLNAKSHAFFSALDQEYNFRYYYNAYLPGEYPNYPSGLNDGTHFQQMGAILMAKMVTDGVRELADHADVGQVAKALNAQYPVSIKANSGSAGRVSLSSTFPEGLTVTLKALAGDGHSFESWKDASGETVASTNIHTFVMDDEAHAFVAYFDNETPVPPPALGDTVPAGQDARGNWQVGDEMRFTADAFDPDGTIDRVEYYAREARIKLGEATEPPYEFVWTVEGGAYDVWAEAYDNHGARGRSQPYSLDIEFSNQFPTAVITSPSAGATFVAGDSVTINATASDADGSVARVEFYVNGGLIAEDTEAPYSTIYDGLTEGSTEIGVRAIDNFGVASALVTRKVGVFYATGGDLLQEAEDAILVGNMVVIDDAAASAGKAVESLGSNPETDYIEFRFNVPEAGYYHLRTLLKAIDGTHDSMFVSIDGASASEHIWDTARSSGYIEDYVKNRVPVDPLELDLDAGAHFVRFGHREPLILDLVELEFDRPRPTNFAPQVALTSPFGGDVFASGETISITADASDSDGSIALVEFYADGVKLGEDSSAPYAYDWSGAPSGSVELTAAAIDDEGAVTVSDPVSISVFFASGGDAVQEAEGASVSGSAILFDDPEASGGQFLRFVDPSGIVSGGVYTLTNVGSGLAMESNGRNVTQAAVSEGANQTFQITALGGGNYSILAVANSENLDAYNSGTVGTYIANASRYANQNWTLIEEEGGYRIKTTNRGDYHIGVAGDSDAAGADVVWSAPSASDYQLWNIAPVGGGGAAVVEFQFNVAETETYNLLVRYRAMDEDHNSVFVSIDDAPSDQYLWNMPVSAAFSSGFVTDGAQAEPLEIELTAGAHTVRFSYSEPVDIDTVELKLDPGIGFKSGETYQLINVGSGMALEIEGRAVRQGVNEFLDTQQWRITEVADGVFSILNKDSGESLDHYPGDEIGTWTYNSTKANQQWVIVPVEEGIFTISAVNSPAEMIISPADFSDADEANIIQTADVGSDYQRWRIVEPGTPEPKAHTVWLLGDSTVANYSSGYYPQAGWGQLIGEMFDPEVEFKNRAVGGTSSKSFYDSFWAPIRDELEAGDFVFIQFGINDANSDPNRRTEPFGSFQDYLTLFVNETQAAGAYPVLVATLRRNAWNGTDPDTLYDAYHDYPVATRQLAGELGVPLIDLDQMTVPLLEGLGPDYTGPFIYMNLLPGEYPNFAGGAADNVHFQEMGAIEMARLVVDGIEALAADANVSALIPYIDPTYEVAVTSSDAAAGLVTRTTRFAEGQNVTIKAKPFAGYTFVQWEDGAGNVVTTDVRFSFEMGAESRSYHAVFAVGAPPEPDPETGILSGATYTITNVGSGLALANPSARLVTQETPTGAASQQFVVVKEDDGYYTLTLVGSGERVDSYKNNQVGTWTSSGGTNQDWTITLVDGKYRIESRTYAGNVIGVDGDSDLAGANVGYATDTGSDYQRWTFTEL